ncbi:cytochrome P450 family protein [Nocardia lijiangensis]|uniref:cytochrome P450 family protein n=1 Tax=Nocardia lijiangensis TaxID=299618 RepID=UPI00082D7C4B|nr:cytochrome P450 [Nocardia lijiangensis]
MSAAAVADPYPLYDSMREAGGVTRNVVKTIYAEVDAWIVTSYDDARALLADPRLSKDPAKLPAITAKHATEAVEVAFYPPNLLFSDPPEHTRLRKVFQKAFTMRQVQQMRPWIEAMADEIIQTIEPGREFDLVEKISMSLPIAVIGKLLGLPEERFDEFRQWNAVLASVNSPLAEKQGALGAAFVAMAELIKNKRVEPGEDLATALIQAADDDGDPMTEAEVISTLLLVANAGYETTANMISTAVLALAEHPEQRQLLKSEPSRINPAIDEFLRYESPLNFTTVRFTKEAVEVSGTTIPAEEIVFISLCAANRDPNRFENPNALDLARGDRGHLAFGHGIHHCVGAPLARMEGEIILRKLIETFDVWKLSVPARELKWRNSMQFRGLVSLPLQMS